MDSNRPRYEYLQSWLVPFNEEVLDFLAAEGRKLMLAFIQFHYSHLQQDFKETTTQSEEDDSSWPRGRAIKLEWEAEGRLLAVLNAEYIHWNPRDGESWSFRASFVFPGYHQPVNLSFQDNASGPCPELYCLDGNEAALQKCKSFLDHLWNEKAG